MSGFTYVEKFVIERCDCGINYALPQSFIERRRADHKTFCCPNGCKRYFPSENEADKANRKAREARERIERLQTHLNETERIITTKDYQVRYYKGQLTKLKKKI